MEGIRKIDVTVDSVRQLAELYNNLSDIVISEKDDFTSNSEYSTGLAWDSSQRNIYLDLVEDGVPIGQKGKGKGIYQKNKKEFVREQLKNLNLDPSNLSNLTSNQKRMLSYRETISDLRDSRDHKAFKMSYVQKAINTLRNNFYNWVIPIYYWSSDSLLEADDLTVVKPKELEDYQSGRWLLSQGHLLPDQERITKNIWVSPSGDDDSIGDQFSPLSSISTALSEASIGTTIFLLPGVYSFNQTITINKPVNLIAPYKGVTFEGNVSPTIILKAGCSIKWVYFQGKGSINDLINVEIKGYERSDGELAYSQPFPEIIRIKSCSIESVSEGIYVTSDKTDNRVAPLHKEVPVLEVKDCWFNTPSGISIRSENLATAYIKGCSFHNCHQVAKSDSGGVLRFFDCHIYRGNNGLVANGNGQFRHVGYLKEDLIDTEVSEIWLQFYQSEVVFIDDNFYPQAPILMRVVSGGSSSDQNLEPIISQVLERQVNNGEVHYRCQLTNPTYFESLTQGSRFEAFQVPFIEAVNLSTWRLGVGTSPEDQGFLPDDNAIFQENGEGIISVSQTFQT